MSAGATQWADSAASADRSAHEFALPAMSDQDGGSGGGPIGPVGPVLERGGYDRAMRESMADRDYRLARNVRRAGTRHGGACPRSVRATLDALFFSWWNDLKIDLNPVRN